MKFPVIEYQVEWFWESDEEGMTARVDFVNAATATAAISQVITALGKEYADVRANIRVVSAAPSGRDRQPTS